MGGTQGRVDSGVEAKSWRGVSLIAKRIRLEVARERVNGHGGCQTCQFRRAFV